MNSKKAERRRLILIADVLFIAVVLSACQSCSAVPGPGNTQRAAASGVESGSTPIFQVVSRQDGKLFRLNTQTGQMHLVADDGLVEFSDKWKLLRVGEYYEMADASTDEKFLKYLGHGTFEKSKFAVRAK